MEWITGRQDGTNSHTHTYKPGHTHIQTWTHTKKRKWKNMTQGKHIYIYGLKPRTYYIRPLWAALPLSPLRVTPKGLACNVELHFLHRMMSSMISCLMHWAHNSSFEIFLCHQTPSLHRSLRLLKVWSLSMIVFVCLQVSDPYGRTDLKFESSALSTERGTWIFRRVLRMEKVTYAFLQLASISSSVPQVVVTGLPRYLKAVTSVLQNLSSSPQMLSPVVVGDWNLISLILDAFTLSPTLTVCCCSASIFCCTHVIFWISNTRSSAKSRSSRFCNKVNWIPVLLSPNACLVATKSWAIRKLIERG